MDIQRSLLVMEASDRLSAEVCLGDIYFEHLDHNYSSSSSHHRSAVPISASKSQPSGTPVQQQQQQTTNASHSSNPNNSPGQQGVHWPQIPAKFNTAAAAAGSGDMDWHQQGGGGGGGGMNKPSANQIPNINPGSSGSGGGIAMTAAGTGTVRTLSGWMDEVSTHYHNCCCCCCCQLSCIHRVYRVYSCTEEGPGVAPYAAAAADEHEHERPVSHAEYAGTAAAAADVLRRPVGDSSGRGGLRAAAAAGPRRSTR